MRQAKYRAIKTITEDGHKFDSRKEARRYMELKQLENKGFISGLEMQKPFVLVESQKGELRNERPVKYIADFVYFNHAGFLVVEDVKGVKTPEYVIKRKLMKKEYGIEIVEV